MDFVFFSVFENIYSAEYLFFLGVKMDSPAPIAYQLIGCLANMGNYADPALYPNTVECLHPRDTPFLIGGNLERSQVNTKGLRWAIPTNYKIFMGMEESGDFLKKSTFVGKVSLLSSCKRVAFFDELIKNVTPTKGAVLIPQKNGKGRFNGIHKTISINLRKPIILENKTYTSLYGIYLPKGASRVCYLIPAMGIIFK